MIIGIPKESKIAEYRVGLTPTAVAELVGHGHKVIVEHDAGARIDYTDEAYRKAGASVVDKPEQVFQEAELIVKVKEPNLEEGRLLQAGQGLFTFLHLAAFPELTDLLCASGVTGIAYETVTDASGRFPLLAPMSEVAGRLSIQAAAYHLQSSQGGRGVLLAGVPGVAPGRVVIIGGGVVGRNAALMAVGLGADVIILDRNTARMRELEVAFGDRVRTLYSNRQEIERQIRLADVVVGAVLVAGDSAPTLVDRGMLKTMQPGSVIVDVAIDQGGCFETSRPTTHTEPTYVEEGVVHYCVANMPGAVPRTSTQALTNVTLPYVLQLADKGVEQALLQNSHLLAGLNVYRHEVTHPGVAHALHRRLVTPGEMLGTAIDG